MAAFPRMTFEHEMKFRHAAMEWLAMRTNDGAEPMYYLDIEEFEYDGAKIPLRNRYKGIWKPASFGAALSFTTKFTKPGKERPYEDAVGADGLMRYKWRDGGPDIPDNRALRAAMEAGLPLIWFYGVAEGFYQAVFPVFLVGEEADEQQFMVEVADMDRLSRDGQIFSEGPSLSVVEKRYAARMARQRLHQPVFRSMVMRAYDEHCAVCALHHVELLDAAHILPDAHEDGIAAVTNGLSLCKIHHSAYDRKFMGIRPDYVVEIRADLLNEVDGPMLRHGLQERHGERLLVLPQQRKERPSSALLEKAYLRFREAA